MQAASWGFLLRRAKTFFSKGISSLPERPFWGPFEPKMTKPCPVNGDIYIIYKEADPLLIPMQEMLIQKFLAGIANMAAFSREADPLFIFGRLIVPFLIPKGGKGEQLA